MSTLGALVRRNIKLFFKDKGMFFTSLVTPGILLVLYATFLAKTYRDGISSSFPENVEIAKGVVDGLVGGQLLSSLLATSCVTVAFCSNMISIQDKVTGAARDFGITPVSRSSISLAYYIATVAVTMIVSLVAIAACCLYLAVVGWYLSFTDVLLLIFDSFLLVLFGTALSSLINHFLSTQGQMSAVGTVVSAGYGFICGAYMPISTFGAGLQKVLSFFPGTYGTSLLRNHALSGAIDELAAAGVPPEVITGIRDSVDCNLYFYETAVSVPAMMAVVFGAALLLIGAYVLLFSLSERKNRKKNR